MRIKIFFILSFFLFVIPLSLGIETNLKNEYSPLETLIIKIDGNFLENIKADNIFFYSDGIFISMIYDINKIENSYYLYAILPNKERNYTLIIKDVYYFEEGKIKKEDLKFNFSVKGNISLCSINPGFIITNKDFFIKVISNKGNINVKTTFEKEIKNFSLKAGEEKNILFSIKDIKNNSMKKIIIECENQKYEIPILIYPYHNLTNNNIENFSNFTNILIFYPLNETIYIKNNSQINKKIYLFNNGTFDIKEIKITISSELNDYVDIYPKKINIIPSKNYSEIEIGIISPPNDLYGNIAAESFYPYYFTEMKFFIKLTENESLVNESKEYLKHCYEIGKICNQDEYCNSSLEKSLEYPYEKKCCLNAECVKLIKDKNNKNTNFVVFILIIILGGLIFFIIKKTKIKKKEAKEILKERTKRYEEKFDLKETKESLER
ncbi:MAG: hypothetical protein QW117_01760 [Candidatus Pacearchaeota archaeon]